MRASRADGRCGRRCGDRRLDATIAARQAGAARSCDGDETERKRPDRKAPRHLAPPYTTTNTVAPKKFCPTAGKLGEVRRQSHPLDAGIIFTSERMSIAGRARSRGTGPHGLSARILLEIATWSAFRRVKICRSKTAIFGPQLVVYTSLRSSCKRQGRTQQATDLAVTR